MAIDIDALVSRNMWVLSSDFLYVQKVDLRSFLRKKFRTIY